MSSRRLLLHFNSVRFVSLKSHIMVSRRKAPHPTPRRWRATVSAQGLTGLATSWWQRQWKQKRKRKPPSTRTQRLLRIASTPSSPLHVQRQSRIISLMFRRIVRTVRSAVGLETPSLRTARCRHFSTCAQRIQSGLKTCSSLKACWVARRCRLSCRASIKRAHAVMIHGRRRGKERFHSRISLGEAF